jgi:DNA mismatch repair ATPase MutS
VRKALLPQNPCSSINRTIAQSPKRLLSGPTSTSVRDAKKRKYREKFALNDLYSGEAKEGVGSVIPDEALDGPLVAERLGRGRSKRATGGLEQGLLTGGEPLEPLEPLTDSVKRYPPVIAQALDNMTRLPSNCVLLTRIGGFYELLFSHAEQWASRLGLKLAKKRTVVGDVPMAGFPFWQLEKFVKILVEEEERYVAICEEYPFSVEPKAGKNPFQAERNAPGLLWERKIARIITPGTLIDEGWIEGGENHFLLAVEAEDGMKNFGLAWADLGTGEVWCQLCDKPDLAAELGRIAPKEVVVSSGVGKLPEFSQEWSGAEQRFSKYVVSVHDTLNVQLRTKKGRVRVWESVTDGETNQDILKSLSTLEFSAAARLLDYVESRLPGTNVKLQAPIRRKQNEVMGIDINSMRGLEIKTTQRDGSVKGSLLHTVNRTVTRGGKRLLGNWLSMLALISLSVCSPLIYQLLAASPSTDIPLIDTRLDMVETFLHDEKLREDIVEFLKRTYDSQRIVQKFSLGRGDAEDLLALARTIKATDTILQRLEEADNDAIFRDVLARMNVPLELAETIFDSIDEEGLRKQQNEVADVAATVTGAVDLEEAREAAKNIGEVMEDVSESGGAGKKRGRRRRISRGIEKAVNRNLLTEQDGDEAWTMKKT